MQNLIRHSGDNGLIKVSRKAENKKIQTSTINASIIAGLINRQAMYNLCTASILRCMLFD